MRQLHAEQARSAARIWYCRQAGFRSDYGWQLLASRIFERAVAPLLKDRPETEAMPFKLDDLGFIPNLQRLLTLFYH
jgi:hypothetical protein